MFTGIIEDMGLVTKWQESGPNGYGWVLEICADNPKIFFQDANNGMYIGASVCVSGVCLTVTAFDEKSGMMQFGVAPETIRRTNFATLRAKESRVNLERASLASGRNSGHYVQGHVDGVGKVIDRWFEQESLWFKIEISSELARGIVEKGFIAVEGTSLTVCEVNKQEPAWFTLMLIDHTQKHIILPLRKVGDQVNLECDVMAKYAASAVTDIRKEMEALEKKMNTTVALLEKRISQLEEEVVAANKRSKLTGN
jgi:riboflavin synthase